jgi:pantoate--beta-alanine ligase
MDATLGAVTIGLVPVMGPLHAGHLGLIRRSHAENDDTIVAMVDPGGKLLDIGESDLKEAGEEGARIFYVPAPSTVYPDGFATLVQVQGLADRWEGASRLGHFDRVTTLITILLNQLQPTRTYLGEKHLQQVAVVERVHEDLGLSGEIVPCPTVRDPDGLPLSSYSSSLTGNERAAALAVPDAMFTIQQRALDGETDVATLEEGGRQIIASQPLLTLDYLAIVDPETFEPLTEVATGARAIVAATIDGTRVIDNVYLQRGTGHPG